MGRSAVRVSIRLQRVIHQSVIFAGRLPPGLRVEPGVFVRGLRSALRMSQAQLARRCGLPRPHITRLEAGTVDAQVGTLRRVYEALFCDMVVLPLPRKRPGDALAERRLEKRPGVGIWD